MFYQLLTELRPVIDPESQIAFRLFQFEIKWYAVLILFGAVLGALIGYYVFAKRLHLPSDYVFEGLAYGLIFGVIGARLYYVLFYPGNYQTFWDVINPRNGGLAIHGALIATAIYLPIYCKIRKIKLLYIVEIAAPLILLAQVVGRWGNFMNQEAFGPLINVFGGLENAPSVLTDEMLMAQREVLHQMWIPNFIIDRMYITHSSAAGFMMAGYYHPTFLYESAANLIGIIAYMIARKYIKRIYVGDGLSFYLLWYGIVRFFIEGLRTDPLMIGNTGIKVAQLISIVFVIGGIILLVVRRVCKFQLISCKEALYGKDSTIMKVEIDNDQNHPGFGRRLFSKGEKRDHPDAS